ncbi:isochorismate synthase [Enterovibrio sp. ZSDZ42]|uniref:Isochorismate synthase MenF n=1 Tax=Enterovibrio gelatinilyticus TaxID=2899819 RepID=A0ABT5QYB4_9GAMM|nr:isochorismate synthase [Enterovibrio sp. ZSDZ42]MDD1793013.1 isochorismate synthase [Enterovibrio sp. ZSDZ42]
MTDLNQAIAQLVDSLSTLSPIPHQLRVSFSWSDSVDPIEWLDAQPIFPKFYWQTRDTRDEVLVLGQVKTFTDPLAAETVLASGQRIWGGRSFDGRTERNQRCLQSFFFLPQIEIVRQGEAWSITVNFGDDLLKTQAALSKLTLVPPPLSPPECHIISTEHSPSYPQWSNMIDRALTQIDQTELQKVVLARKTSLSLDRTVSAAQLLKASRDQNSANFHFMLALDAKHCFVGSTPERLFHRRAQALSTEALAGTIGRGASSEDDLALAQWLLNDSKNAYENRLVVDDISARLTDYCETLAVEETPHLVRLRKVQHLKRAIDAVLNPDVTSSALLDSLQPTAAIAGLPRESAVSFIVENEPFVRGWYSGSVGYLGTQQSEFCVAIRSALMMGDALHLFAGAGIVPGSDALSEWHELDRKVSTLLSLLKPLPDSTREKKAG